MSKTLGQIAYEAAMSDLAGPWADKADQVKLVWEAGAKAVAERCTQEAYGFDDGKQTTKEDYDAGFTVGANLTARRIGDAITALINGGEDAD